VDAFSHFVEYDSPSLAARHIRPGLAVQAIAGYVAELVRDGDTLQIGGGSTSFGVVYCELFGGNEDLGWHAEITPSPVVRLVRDGVINGRRKSIDHGKAVSCGIVGDEEDWAYLEDNPVFDLRVCSYVLDPRNIAANDNNDNVVAINAALMVDLTGQIASESIGPTMLSGIGGLLEVVIGAMWSRGGRSITVLPATRDEGRSSRIVPLLPEGTVVSVPRLLADLVVTEHGVARLLGKTMWERADALVAIAQRDFRTELRAAAQRLLYP
jgi:4-hydroxybutyrate CoA-transferase